MMPSQFKKILLLYKLSTYEHLGDRRNRPIPEVNRFRLSHERHYRALAKIEGYLRTQKIPYQKSQRGERIRYTDFDLILTIGGDGTFLEAAQHAEHQIILGVNSDPRLSVGRFCAADAKEFSRIFNQLIRKRAPIISLQRFALKVNGKILPVKALNDILVCHANPAAMSHYVLDLGDRKEEQCSSGIWIATAAGSTSAIHSAGGRILPPTSSQFQYLPREIYFGKPPRNRLLGGILKSQQKLKITSLMREGVFYVDGAHQKFSFPFGQKLEVAIAQEPLWMVKP
jgi:NAD+ kinase